MTAREYLEQYQNALWEERRLRRHILRLRDRLAIHGIDSSREKIQVTKRNDGQAALVAALVDLEKEQAAKRRECLAIMEEVTAAIESLDDQRLRTILWMRYVEGAPWRDVSKRTGYSYRYAFRLHTLALLEIAKTRPDLT